MAGQIEWAALPMLACLHGIDDMDRLVTWLVEIRDQYRATREKGNG